MIFSSRMRGFTDENSVNNVCLWILNSHPEKTEQLSLGSKTFRYIKFSTSTKQILVNGKNRRELK